MTELITVTPLRRELSLTRLPRKLPPPRGLAARMQWASLAAMARLAPTFVVDQLYRAYFTPMRYRASPAEIAVLAEAAVSHRWLAGKHVVIYSWNEPEFPWERRAQKTILLVHGWAGAAAQMTPFVAPLRRAGYRILAVDAPAHGASEGDRTTLVEMAEVLSAIAAAEAEALTGVVAHSLGASAALLALSQGTQPPKLVLLAAGARLDTYPVRFAVAAGAGEDVGRELSARLSAQFGAHVLHPVDTEGVRAAKNVDALVVHDIDDAEAPYAGALELVEALPRARLVSTAGLGHRRLLRDAPVIDEVARFIGA